MVITTFTLFYKKVLIFAFFFLLLSNRINLNGQGTAFQYFYRVYFVDKGNNSISNYIPGQLLSERAIARREKAGIQALHITDLPVFNGYYNQIITSGLKLHCTSKWMNTALFKSEEMIDINILLSLPYVQDVKIVKHPAPKSILYNKLDFSYDITAQEYDRPLTMINGRALHQSGFTGNGILIAVLDGGFLYTDNASSLTALRTRKGIISTYDFVLNDNQVYNYHNHGTSVLSVLAGNIPGLIAGTAPGADFLLLRTEDTSSEFPVEEDYWAAAAEYADSAGVDIISSSLGYSTFDDSSMDYKYSDMDGNSAFITLAADIAVSKGILVFNSAGNERNNSWRYITAPSDGYNVLAIGAVDANNAISNFSSAGPSADNRIKPDLVAMGVTVPVQVNAQIIAGANGTSFSCPVLSGITACLLQAVPKATVTEVIQTLHTSSDRYHRPDSLYGFGIPDMVQALSKLQEKHAELPDKESVISPNPTSGSIEISFKQPPGALTIEIYSSTGKLISKQVYPQYAGHYVRVNELQRREQGIYIIRLITGNSTFVHKVIKINN
jgi:serine protease AprX